MIEKPTLIIDGYIAQTFGPQDAEEYHVSLLRREPGQGQFQAYVADTGEIFATPTLGSTSGQHDWVIDYVVRDLGPVIKQKLWTPKKPSHKLRWVDREQLHPPIFFIHKNSRDLGLRLNDAAAGDCTCLLGAEEAAPVGSMAHAHIRINVRSNFCVHYTELTVRVNPSQWHGYVHLDWNEQISIHKQTYPRESISLETFAKHVARKTLKFMDVISNLLPKILEETDVIIYQIAKNNGNYGDQRYCIGDKYIAPHDVMLIGTVQVSHGSWMPILQLNNGYAQCLEM